MKYKHIVQASFLERPNRFIAYVDLGGKREKVHVKNTGRCRELLLPGATVYLEQSDNPNRSTGYDLIAVEKEIEPEPSRLINMDSQAPNKVVGEWLLKKELFDDLVLVRPEMTTRTTPFEFYEETSTTKIIIEQ